MSVDMYVLCADALPLKSEWQKAIEQQHFPLSLSPDFDPAKDSGFWPGTLKGATTGFEFYKLNPPEWERRPGVGKPGTFLSGAALSSHSEFTGLLASILTAVAIARTCHGIVYDPQEDKPYRDGEMDQLVEQMWKFSGMYTLKP